MDHDDIVEAIRAKKKPVEPQEEPLNLLDEEMPFEDVLGPEPEETEVDRLKRRLKEILG